MVKPKKSGFTLIELIVVIAILAALLLILVPQVMGFTETAGAVQCQQTRQKIIEVYNLYEVKGSPVSPADLLENKDSLYFTSTPKCSAGGELSVRMIGSNLSVKCSKHGTSTGGGAVLPEEEMRQNMVDAIADAKNMSREDKLKYFGRTNNITNDQYRDYLKQFVYNGEWPELDSEIVKAAGKSDSYVIEVCFNHSSGYNDPNLENAIIYAKPAASQTGWNTPLIYNPEDQKWYAGPTKNSALSINDKSWAQVKEMMEQNHWTAVEVK